MGKIDWSELQYDLIGEIAKSIGTVEDFVSFSQVCPSWRLAAVKENWVAGPQLPWLALAEKYEEEEKEKGCRENRRGFFNFKRNKRYELDIPQHGPSRSFGSGLGWIVSVTLDLEIHMINPLSGLKLRLPHLHTLKRMPQNCDGIEVRNPAFLESTHPDYIEPEWFLYYVRKAIVCKRNQQLFVAVIYGEVNFFAIARPGDESWIEVEDALSQYIDIEDAVYFNGQLLGLCSDASIYLCEFDWIQAPKSTTIVPSHNHLKFSNKIYLVESMGNLLMVVRWRHDYDDGEHDVEFVYKTVGFDIYKLDFQNKKWLELKNLGDIALFLGDSYSVSLSSTHLCCKGNSIYYTDDNFERWLPVEKQYGGHDMGIFSLKDKALGPIADKLASDDLCSAISCPVWMIPSLF